MILNLLRKQQKLDVYKLNITQLELQVSEEAYKVIDMFVSNRQKALFEVK